MPPPPPHRVYWLRELSPPVLLISRPDEPATAASTPSDLGFCAAAPLLPRFEISSSSSPRLISLALVRSSGPRLRAIVVVFPRVIPWGLWSGLHAPIRGGFFEFRLGLLRISVGSSWIACRREKEVGCFGPSWRDSWGNWRFAYGSLSLAREISCLEG